MNNIASNIYARVDADGRQFMLLKEIVDHIKPKDVNSKCKFNVCWKDDSMDWVTIAALND
jgi:hypothetical protein